MSFSSYSLFIPSWKSLTIAYFCVLLVLFLVDPLWYDVLQFGKHIVDLLHSLPFLKNVNKYLKLACLKKITKLQKRIFVFLLVNTNTINFQYELDIS